MTNTRKPIPWIFKTNPLLKTWSWNTEHFDAVIIQTQNINFCTWKIIDKTGNPPTTIGLGEELTFLEAETELLERLGKSYPTKLGYGAYAGDLVTTFVIKDGRKIDFSPYVGSTVIVEAYNKSNPGTNQILVGVLSVSHFNLELQTDREKILVIPPAFIINVRKEYDPTGLQETPKKTSSSRTIAEEWRKGCTGSPGFLPNTVIHNPNDEFCSFHDKD